jgi:hypothetical protein
MKKIILALALIGLCLCSTTGCDKKSAAKQPQVKVERVERNNSSSLKVSYENHSCNNYGHYTELQSLEQLRAYKTQVQFLLSQIEEAEKRMDQNEQK